MQVRSGHHRITLKFHVAISKGQQPTLQGVRRVAAIVCHLGQATFLGCLSGNVVQPPVPAEARSEPKLPGALLQRNQPRLKRVVADGAAVFGFDFEMWFRLEDFDPLHLLAEGFHEAAQDESRLRGAEAEMKAEPKGHV
jgi:hypothetical protein